MKKFIKSNRFRVSVVGLLVSLLVIMNPLSIKADLPVKISSLTIGHGQKVLTIGNRAYAAGSIDYGVDGVDDNIQFTQAIAVLNSVGGGEIVALSGNYSFSATVNVPANVMIKGTGVSTYFAFNGVNPLFTATGNNVTFKDLRSDAGSISMGVTTGWLWENVTIGTSHYTQRMADSLASIGTTDITRWLQNPGAGFGRPTTYSRPISLIDAIVYNTQANESVYLNQATGAYGYEYRFGSAASIDAPAGEGRWAVGSYNNGTEGWVVLESENKYATVFATGTTNNPPWAPGGSFAVPVMKLGGNATQGSRYITVYEPIITPEAVGGSPALVYTDPTGLVRSIQVNNYMVATAPNAQVNIGIASGISTNTTSNSNVTGLWAAFYGKVSHVAAAGTMSSASAFYAEVPTVSAGKTITNFYGFRTPDLSGWAGTVTNAYGIYTGNVTGGGTLNYAIYAGGGRIHLAGLPVYANNAAAIAGGLVAGDLYRTNADPDFIAVVR